MLTQLQRDAMTRAQAGDWSLADAMELMADGRRWHNGEQLLGGCRGGGRLRFFVYGDHDECPGCWGDGSLGCKECGAAGDIDCSACDTKGDVACPFCEQACKTEPAIPCAVCNNTRRVECSDCKGKGVGDCPECDDGRVECSDCDGSGEDSDHIVKLVVDMNERVIYRATDDHDRDGPPVYVDFTREQAEKILRDYHNPPKPAPATSRGMDVQITLIGDLAA